MPRIEDGKNVPQSQQLTIEQALARAKKAAKQGKASVALQLYNAILQRQPDHPVAKKGLRKLQKKLPQSQSEHAQIANPPQDQINAVIDLCHSGQMERAEQRCKDLLQAYPKSVIVINVLGVALQRQGKLEEAVQFLDKAIELKPDFADAYLNHGIALKDLGRPDDALASYAKALELKPDFAEAYHNRGNAQQEIGLLVEAEASYNQAIRLKPDFPEAHRNLSALKQFKPADPQIGLMEGLYADSRPDGSNRMQLCFALAKAHEDLGEYDTSFRYLEEGNRLRHKELHYDIDTDKMLFAKIRAIFSAGSPPADVAHDEDMAIQPLLIVGMMRSGTSLVEQILASHSKVHGAGELEVLNGILGPALSDLPDQDVRQEHSKFYTAAINKVRSRYLAALTAQNAPEKFITDKMPLNFRWIGFILSAFPTAKVINLNRDPMATCWSIYKHYFPDEGNAYAYDLRDLAEYYRLYVDLMSFWRERYTNSIYDLCYENLTENQEEETRKLLAFCDLEWEDQCLEFHKTKRAVKTTSAAQIRKKMYPRSSEAWRKYEDHLQPLQDHLAYQDREDSQKNG